MRRILFGVLACLILVEAASAQQIAIQPSRIHRAAHAVGHEIKTTFTDMRHDPLWALYVSSTIAINVLDTGSTIYGLRHDAFVEGNPLLPRRPSTGFLVGLTTGATLVQLGGFHVIREAYTNSCRKQAADPNSKWNDPRIHVQTRDPESCKYGIDIVAMTPDSFHIPVVVSNIRLLEKSH